MFHPVQRLSMVSNGSAMVVRHTASSAHPQENPPVGAHDVEAEPSLPAEYPRENDDMTRPVSLQPQEGHAWGSSSSEPNTIRSNTFPQE